MKKYLSIISVFIAACFISACSNVDDVEAQGVSGETVTKEYILGDLISATRAITDDDINVKWENNDLIYYFDNTSNSLKKANVYAVSDGNDITTGTGTKARVQVEVAREATTITVIYAGKEAENNTVSKSGSSLKIENNNGALPLIQDGSFKVLSMGSASVDASTITLKNATSWIKVKFGNTVSDAILNKVDHLVLMGYNNEDLAGNLTVNMNAAGNLTVQAASTFNGTEVPSQKAIMLRPADGFTADAAYYFNVMAQSEQLSKGLTIYLEDAQNNFLGSVEAINEVDLSASSMRYISNMANHIQGLNLESVGHGNPILLAGHYWASHNIGAANNSPRGIGDFYSFGETTPAYSTYNGSSNPSAEYTWDLYKNRVNNDVITTGGILNESNDVAKQTWGGDWRLPNGGHSHLLSSDYSNYASAIPAEIPGEMLDLAKNTTNYPATLNNIKGCKFVDAANKTTIFLPYGSTYENAADLQGAAGGWKATWNNEGFYLSGRAVGHWEGKYRDGAADNCMDMYLSPTGVDIDGNKYYAICTNWYKYRPRNVRAVNSSTSWDDIDMTLNTSHDPFDEEITVMSITQDELRNRLFDTSLNLWTKDCHITGDYAKHLQYSDDNGTKEYGSKYVIDLTQGETNNREATIALSSSGFYFGNTNYWINFVLYSSKAAQNVKISFLMGSSETLLYEKTVNLAAGERTVFTELQHLAGDGSFIKIKINCGTGESRTMEIDEIIITKNN